MRLLNFVADLYKQQKYRVRIVTTTPALTNSLTRKGWVCTRAGRVTKGSKKADKALQRTNSKGRNTYAFEYTGQ